MSDSLQPHGLYSPWNSLGQNTGVGSLSLLYGTFLSQESNPSLLYLLHWQADSLPLISAICHLYIFFDEVFVKVFGLLFIYLFLLHGLWFLSSLTKDRTQALSSES